MPKPNLSDKQERDVALSYLCNVSPEYIQRRWNVSESTSRALVSQCSAKRYDQLLELYKDGLNRYRNAIHLYLVFNEQTEISGVQPKIKILPYTGFVDRERESEVYEAVDEDIFKPRNRLLLYECLLPICNLHNEIVPERTLQTEQIVMPLPYKDLFRAYQKMARPRKVGTPSDAALDRAYRAVQEDIAKRFESGFIVSPDTPIEKISGLSSRSQNALKNADILTVGDLTQNTELQVIKKRDLGKIGLSEIEHVLASYGLELSTEI